MVTIGLPEIPGATLDVAQDEDGYSAELTVERVVSVEDFDAFSEACLGLAPVVTNEGPYEIRGLVSMDDESLWVYVHGIGPGRFGHDQEHAAFVVLEKLWQDVHERAAAL